MLRLCVLIAGLGLAACQPEAAPELEGAPPAAAPAPDTPAPAASPPPLDMTAIPSQYLGKWDASAEECAQASIMTLTISPNELRFHESIGEIETVTPEGANAINVAGPFEGEGEAWDGALRLELSADANMLTVTNNGVPTTRVRCS
jgi:hypothetical protein